MIELVVRGQQIELKEKEKIKYTKEVADIADISTVNSSYTNSFKAPRTPENKKTLEFLGEVGDLSTIPYQKVEAQLRDNGLPLVKRGWLSVKQTGKDYDLGINDGIIDFFKAIEGKKLGEDVDLSELNHVKSVQTVINSFTNEFYTYLVNDYGGKTILYDEIFFPYNIDYLVPSARVKYLFERIFETFGFTFSGSIFSDENYLNAWLTFPKTNSELVSTNIANFEVDELPPLFGGFVNDQYGQEYVSVLAIPFTESEILLPNYLQVVVEMNRLRSIFITQTNNYQFKINFDALANYRLRLYANPNYTGLEQAPLKLMIFKNGQPLNGGVIIGGEDELNLPISATAGDLISFKIYALTYQEFNEWRVSQELEPFPEDEFFFHGAESLAEWNSFDLSIDQVEYQSSDFNNTFKDFGVPEFMKEFMWRFGLIPIPDVETNHITFYNIDEMLDESRGVKDWSEYYIERTSEKYEIGSYAQRNYLRHKYNTEDAEYNDGLIEIANANLKDENTLLSSKTYSPELDLVEMPVALHPFIYVYPTLIWQTEAKENTTTGELEISYKGLTGRYYWLKKLFNPLTVNFASEQLGESEDSDGFNYASTLDTTFADLTPKYHTGHIRLLNDIKVQEIEFDLSLVQFNNIDFTKLIYVKQEASYYKLNKISWEENKPCKAEVIRIKRA